MKKRNLLNKVLTTGLAAAMVMSMGMPVFAGTYNNPEGSTPASVKSLDAYSISKTQTTNDTVPSDTKYTFTVEAGSKEGTTSGVTVASPALSTVNASKQVELEQDDFTNGTATTDAIFKNEDFANADDGIYDYTVSEVKPSTYNSDYWTYDDTVYTIRVKVTDGAIAAITATPDGDTTKKADKISFTNTYVAWGNDKEETPTTTPTDALVVSKTTDGNAYTDGDSFTFKITFTKADNVPATTVPKDSAGKAYVYGENTVTLTSGNSISFAIPDGTTYKVEETDSLKADKTEVSTDNKQTYSEGTTASGTIDRNNSYTVDFKNTKSSSNVLTGIVNNYGGLIAVVAIAAAGMIIVAVRRHRYEA